MIRNKEYRRLSAVLIYATLLQLQFHTIINISFEMDSILYVMNSKSTLAGCCGKSAQKSKKLKEMLTTLGPLKPILTIPLNLIEYLITKVYTN